MIYSEPKIKVALLQNASETKIILNGNFQLINGPHLTGPVVIKNNSGQIEISDISEKQLIGQQEVLIAAAENSTFSLDVQIGIDFHWQQTRRHTYRGDIVISAKSDSSFDLINEINLEDYLVSVISSEMSANAPLEFLKAQAITARSWLVAMLERKKEKTVTLQIDNKGDKEIIRWQDTNDHSFFDVCADDHCQRYQGITPITSDNVPEAIAATRGVYLVYDNKICDARYHKACGGVTENYETAWEDTFIPYLKSVPDSEKENNAIESEDDARKWLMNKPAAYCNTQDEELLRRILPSFDQKTADFYRWQVSYKPDELAEIIFKKSGIDFGQIKNIAALKRGPSGRIVKLKVEGSKRSVIVGKELEIRRWLSPSHLLSSAFVISMEKSANGTIESFIFNGGGWGHGVGLCQIGAAVMAAQGFKAEEILSHYFSGAKLQKLYH